MILHLPPEAAVSRLLEAERAAFIADATNVVTMRQAAPVVRNANPDQIRGFFAAG